MFNVDDHQAKLKHLSMFEEHHGEDKVKGIALKVEVQAGAELLDTFDPNLRGVLFHKSGNLRFSKVGPLRWTGDLVGAMVNIDATDLTGQRVVTFEDATVDKFVIEAMEGGAVTIEMRVKCHPDADEMARIFEMVGSDVQLTVEPPKASLQAVAGGKDTRQPELSEAQA